MTIKMVRKVVVWVAALALVSGLGISPASADSLDQLNQRLADAQRNARSTDANLEEITADLEHSDAQLTKAYRNLQTTGAKITVAQAALDKADAEFSVAQRDSSAIDDKLTSATGQATAIQKQIDDNAVKTETARTGVAEMARQMAKGAYGLGGVELVIGARTLDEALTEYNYSQTALRTESNALVQLREANAIATNMQVRLNATQATVEDLQTQAAANVKIKEGAQQTAKTAKTSLVSLQTEQQAAAETIEQRRTAEKAEQAKLTQQSTTLTSDIQSLLGLTKKERARLAKEKRAREAAEKKAAEKKAADKKAAEKDNDKPNAGNGGGNSGSGGSGGGTGGGSSGGGSGGSGGGGTSGGGSSNNNGAPSSKGKFSYPTKVPYITSSYGMRFHPILHYYRLHAGTDFRAYCGTAVYASAGGKVVWAKYNGGFGNQVLIDHGKVGGDNIMSSYNHFSKFAVSSGERVKKGDIVGYSGSTGTSTACHLHFEMYRDGVTFNPMSILGK